MGVTTANKTPIVSNENVWSNNRLLRDGQVIREKKKKQKNLDNNIKDAWDRHRDNYYTDLEFLHRIGMSFISNIPQLEPTGIDLTKYKEE